MQIADAQEPIDPAIRCSACEALCCRLPVLLMPDDRIPERFVTHDEHGLAVVAKNDDGWCLAMDPRSMRCTIYAQRPAICREFAMGGAGCREERANWYRRDNL